MNIPSLFIIGTLIIAPMLAASAQQAGYETPRPEHVLLERLAGDWQFERLGAPRNGENPESLGTGVVSAEMIGEFFVVSRWSGTLYGMDYTAVQSLGFDIDRKKYSGYWLDSFMGFCWELNGTVDKASGELTIVTRGPSPSGGTAAYRERYQFNSVDSITIHGEMQQDEDWVTLSTTRLTRRQ
jgi:hypothetical protein